MAGSVHASRTCRSICLPTNEYTPVAVVNRFRTMHPSAEEADEHMETRKGSFAASVKSWPRSSCCSVYLKLLPRVISFRKGVGGLEAVLN